MKIKKSLDLGEALKLKLEVEGCEENVELVTRMFAEVTTAIKAKVERLTAQGAPCGCGGSDVSPKLDPNEV